MHIALLTRGGKGWLGGSQYTKNIAHALKGLPSAKRKTLRVTVVVMPGSDVESFKDIENVADRVVDGDVMMKPYSVPNRVRWKAKRTLGISVDPRLEEFLKRERVDFAYPCRPRKDLLPGLRFADWIPDFQYDYYPDGSNEVEIAGRKAEWTYVTQHVPRIVLSSESAERDCLRLFPVSRGKTFVLPFRVRFPTEHLQNRLTEVLNEYTLPNRFFLVCNLFAPTKNHIVIFEALKLLRDDGVFPTVVCTGDLHDYRNPHFANTILRAINQNGIASQVRLLGVIPRQHQIQLMRLSVALIQPSLFEGWNTAVEEAHCLGKPLILSDIPVHQEQNPPNSLLFDPHSPADLAKAMRAAWEQIPGGIQEAQEVDAVARYQELVVDFANKFLTLASLPSGTTNGGTQISAN